MTVTWSNLKEFGNITGATFGTTQLNSLKNFINNASAIYGSDFEKNIKYIKTVMDATFGNTSNQYSVVLEHVPTRDLGSATVYCENGSNYAFLGYGVNLKYPDYTYLVYRVYIASAVFTYVPFELARGSGLTSDQGSKVGFVIQSVDGTAFCDCTKTYDVMEKLQNVLAANWNVVCQSTQNIHSYAAISNAAWIMTKPAKCIYFIYAL